MDGSNTTSVVTKHENCASEELEGGEVNNCGSEVPHHSNCTSLYLQGNIQALTPCKADEKQHDMGKQNGLVQPSPSMWLLFENFV